jgi:hypothetical protein
LIVNLIYLNDAGPSFILNIIQISFAFSDDSGMEASGKDIFRCSDHNFNPFHHDRPKEKSMRKLLMIIGAIGVTWLLVPYAQAYESHGPWECNESVDEVFWVTSPGTCYQLKAGCKGSAAGAWVEFERYYDEFEVSTDGDPSCEIESEDSWRNVSALKAACDNGDGQTKLELKRRDDLCPVTCEKPDKILGCED